MERIKRLFLILVLMCFVETYAQPSLPQSAPTPNAASLGHYGDVPVSYYTGNPSISIPLYETTVRGVTLPISLDYDASGVQMNVLPSWTGYNWSLSAGGAITRTINGYPDELVLPQNTSTLGFTFHNYFSSYDVLNGLSNSQLETLIASGDVAYDLEPDVFYFNFMGKSGKFFLGNDGKWKVRSDYDIDVIYQVGDANNLLSPFIPLLPKADANDRNQSKTIAGFKLRDTDGVLYEFGYTTNAIEYTIDFFNMQQIDDVNSWWATSWYLTKVTDRLGNVLFDLTYERGIFFAQAFNSYEYSSFDEHESGWGSVSYGEDNYNFPYTIQLDAPVFLKEINAKNGVKISFNRQFSGQTLSDLYQNDPQGILRPDNWYSKLMEQIMPDNTYPYPGMPFYYLQSNEFSSYHYPGSDTLYTDKLLERMGLYKLNQVSVYEPDQSGTYNIFRFTYSNPTERMYLTGISKNNYIMGSLTSNAKYSLEYNNFNQLPLNCITTAVDHWGLYNGRGTYGIPRTRMAIENKRSCDNDKMKYGTLTKITYPTGGSSVIDYEPNDYSLVLSLDRQSMEQQTGIGGGIRVKSITEYDDSTCSKILKRRLFSYTKPNTGLSSGQQFATPKYSWPNWTARNDGNVQITTSTIRYASIVPLTNSYGLNVGYSYVTETNEDGSSKIYHYHNISDGPMDLLQTDAPFNSSAPSPYDKFSEKGYGRGKLLSVIQKDSLGNKVASTTYNYRTTSVIDDWVYAANLKCHFGHVGANTYSYSGRKYRIYYKRYDLAGKNDTLFYSDGTQSTMSESYTYGDYIIQMTSPFTHESSARLLQQKNSTKGSQNYTENYYYPLDNGYTSIVSMAKQSYYLPVVKTERYYDGTMIESDSYSYSSYTINGQSQKLPNSYNTTKKGNTETLVNYLDYTNTGQPQRYKEINGPQTYISWAYYDNYLMCKYQGPIYSTPSFGNNQIFSVNSLLPTIKGLSNQSYPGLFTGYTYYDSNNISSLTTENGITTFYHFNSKRQLDGILDNNNNLIQQFEYNFKNK